MAKLRQQPSLCSTFLQTKNLVVIISLALCAYYLTQEFGQRASSFKKKETEILERISDLQKRFYRLEHSAHLRANSGATQIILTSKIPVVDESTQKFFGTEYGGWVVDSRCLKRGNKIIYGVGAGEDIGWDIKMVEEYGARMYIFDPTEKSAKYVEPLIRKHPQSGNFVFTKEGLSTKEGVLHFTKPANKDHVSMRFGIHTNDISRIVTVPVNTLENWMNRFGHTYLDVLKIDIETAEFSLLREMLDKNFFPMTQLLVEFHQRMLDPKDYHQYTDILRDLKLAGFEIFSNRNNGQEIGFIKVSDVAKHCGP